jgi:predicted O-methyltransferase YrrM
VPQWVAERLELGGGVEHEIFVGSHGTSVQVSRHFFKVRLEKASTIVDAYVMTELIAPELDKYLLLHSTAPDQLLRDLAAETRERTGGAARMQISADEGAFLTMLARLTGVQNAVEVGVFTGFSSICIARGMRAGGRLLACDVSEEWTAIARVYWDRAGLADRIDLRIAPALDTLRSLPMDQTIDFAFIDADKASYPLYYEELVTRLRPGGVIALDNMFLGGRVLDPSHRDESSVALRDLNDTIASDDRVDAVLLAMRDGVMVARRRD